jgi:hypothetical protein
LRVRFPSPAKVILLKKNQPIKKWELRLLRSVQDVDEGGVYFSCVPYGMCDNITTRKLYKQPFTAYLLY